MSATTSPGGQVCARWRLLGNGKSLNRDQSPIDWVASHAADRKGAFPVRCADRKSGADGGAGETYACI